MFEARNEANQIQFDASSFSFYLSEYGYATLEAYFDPDSQDQEGNTIPGNYRYSTVNFNTANDWDYVFYQSSAPIQANYTPVPGFPRNIAINTPEFGPNYGGFSVTYYCFRSTRFLTPQPHGLGMELYNADGSVAYSSARKPLILLAAQKFDSPSQFVTPPGIPDYGYAACVIGSAYSDSNPPYPNGSPDTTVNLGIIGGGAPRVLRTSGFKPRPIGERFRGSILFADTTGLID